MKKSIWVVLAGLLLAAAGWAGWMAYVNSRTTTLRVWVSGAGVDEVRFYRQGAPEQALYTVHTGGADARAEFALNQADSWGVLWQAAPAQYYFVAAKDGETKRSQVVCCETGLTNRQISLDIHGLEDWRQSEP